MGRDLMRFKDGSARQVLVGLNRIGIVGLPEALKRVEESGLAGREAILSLMMEVVGPRNYIPAGQLEAYRTALWREYLRRRGQDFSAYYSEIPVTVRGAAGEERDRFVSLVESVLADHELRPVISYADADESASGLELLIRGEIIARSSRSRRSLEKAVQQTLSHW